MRLIETTESFVTPANGATGVTYDVGDASSISIQVDATVTTPSGASIAIYKSNDGETWSLEGSATNLTADATVWLEDAAPNYRYFRLTFALGSGTIDTADCHILVKG